MRRDCRVVFVPALLLTLILYLALQVSKKGHNRPDELVPSTKVVLLSSSGRTGSTYFSEVLTPAGLNFYEPLRWLGDGRPKPSKEELSALPKEWRKVNEGDDDVTAASKVQMVADLLECELGEYPSVLASATSRETVFGRAHLDDLALKDYQRECWRRDFRLVKTIRLHFRELEEAAAEGVFLPDDAKIILLARDPRAVLASMKRGPPEDWQRELSRPEEICARMAEDAEKAYSMWNEGVRVVHYEDLVSDRDRTLESVLLKHLDRSDLIEPVLNAANAKQSDLGDGYYDTRRPAGFNGEHWREDVSAATVRAWQNGTECRNALHVLGYEVIDA